MSPAIEDLGGMSRGDTRELVLSRAIEQDKHWGLKMDELDAKLDKKTEELGKEVGDIKTRLQDMDHSLRSFMQVQGARQEMADLTDKRRWRKQLRYQASVHAKWVQQDAADMVTGAKVDACVKQGAENGEKIELVQTEMKKYTWLLYVMNIVVGTANISKKAYLIFIAFCVGATAAITFLHTGVPIVRESFKHHHLMF